MLVCITKHTFSHGGHGLISLCCAGCDLSLTLVFSSLRSICTFVSSTMTAKLCLSAVGWRVDGWICNANASLFLLSEREGRKGESRRGSPVDGVCSSPTEPKKDPLSDPEQGCKLLKCYRRMMMKKMNCGVI